MLKAIRNGFVILLVLGAVGGGLFEWWNLDLRWRPKTITKHQDEITKILDGSGWVSPGLSGPKVYMIAYRACGDCDRYEKDEFPKLHGAGIDTRVIMIARADVNGQSKSTATERSTVAELWVNRNWGLFQKWNNVEPEAWTAPGIHAADEDVARSAVVEVGRVAIEKLEPLFKDNGLKLAYPVLVWWAKDGTMKACACEKPQTYGYVRKDLGIN